MQRAVRWRPPLERQFHADAPLYSAVDEQPLLVKLYAEVEPAAIYAWAADEIRDIRHMVEDARDTLAVTMVRGAFEDEAAGRLRLDDVRLLPLSDGRHRLEIAGAYPDGAPFQLATDLFRTEFTAQAREWARVLIASRRQGPVAPTSQGGHRSMANQPLSKRLSKLASIPGEFDKLVDGMEFRAEKFLNRIQGQDARGDALFTKADQRLESTVGAGLDSVDKYLDAVEQATNGGPLDESGKS